MTKTKKKKGGTSSNEFLSINNQPVDAARTNTTRRRVVNNENEEEVVLKNTLATLGKRGESQKELIKDAIKELIKEKEEIQMKDLKTQILNINKDHFFSIRFRRDLKWFD